VDNKIYWTDLAQPWKYGRLSEYGVAIRRKELRWLLVVVLIILFLYWRTGSKFEPIGETCGHKTKEGKKVIVDAVAMQRRRKAIVMFPPSYLINFNFCCCLHWNTVLSSNYSRNYHWELILVFVRVKCG
jgi:hypothetical protein